MLDDQNAYTLSAPRRFLDSPDFLLLVQHALENDPETRDAAIDIIARAGAITLLGEVNTPATKEAAERAARSLVGIADVINLIDVLEPPFSSSS